MTSTFQSARDAERLAHVFEGIAGSIKQGSRPNQADVESALRLAGQVWPNATADRSFRVASDHLLRTSAAAEQGDPRAEAECEAAAHRVATLLHWLKVQPNTPAGAVPLRAGQGNAIDQLLTHYARYAGHLALTP